MGRWGEERRDPEDRRLPWPLGCAVEKLRPAAVPADETHDPVDLDGTEIIGDSLSRSKWLLKGE